MNDTHSLNPSESHEILERLERMEMTLDAVLQTIGRHAPDPEWMPVRQAAQMAGMSLSAVQTRLRRENDRPGGWRIRRRHGYVHVEDWRRYLDAQAEGKQGSGKLIDEAVHTMMEAL